MSEEIKADVADNGGITTGKPRRLTYETYSTQKEALEVAEE